MPERLSLATVLTCVVVAGAVFGCAYALAHGQPAPPAPPPGSPTKMTLQHAPIGELRHASPLPALVVPPPRTTTTDETTTVGETTPTFTTPAPTTTVEPTPTQTPTPPSTPPSKPKPPPAKKPLTFDDSG